MNKYHAVLKLELSKRKINLGNGCTVQLSRCIHLPTDTPPFCSPRAKCNLYRQEVGQSPHHVKLHPLKEHASVHAAMESVVVLDLCDTFPAMELPTQIARSCCRFWGCAMSQWPHCQKYCREVQRGKCGYIVWLVAKYVLVKCSESCGEAFQGPSDMLGWEIIHKIQESVLNKRVASCLICP